MYWHETLSCRNCFRTRLHPKPWLRLPGAPSLIQATQKKSSVVSPKSISAWRWIRRVWLRKRSSRRQAVVQISLFAEITMPAILRAGVDEAGRGPLAGPVFAAAVILDDDAPIVGLNDSKKLTAARREELALEVRERALAWCIASASVAEIDQFNILGATMLAM